MRTGSREKRQNGEKIKHAERKDQKNPWEAKQDNINEVGQKNSMRKSMMKSKSVSGSSGDDQCFHCRAKKQWVVMEHKHCI